METEAILALYDLEQRINIEYPGVRKEQRPQVIRYVSETGSLHFILYSRLSGADVEAVIAEEPADRGAVWVSTADDGLGVQMGERPYNNFCRVIR